MDDAELILASGSPRRRELLALMGVPFTVDATEVDETCSLPAREAVEELSRRKALAGAKVHPGRVVLAADTLVAVDGLPLGKPQDEQDAARMLRMLSGRWHQVFTGVCVVSKAGGGDFRRGRHGRALQPDDGRGNQRLYRDGRADGQGGRVRAAGRRRLWVEEIRGSNSCVIGLPLALTRRLLLRCGLRALPRAAGL